PQPMGNQLADYVPFGTFPAAGGDRWVGIAVRNDDEWRILSDVIARTGHARSDVLCQQAWRSAAGRMASRDEIESHLAEWTSQFDRYELAQVLQAEGVSCVPLLDPEEADSTMIFRTRKLAREISH